MGTVRRWWPLELADRAVARETMSEAIGAWSSRWFVKSPVVVSNFRSVRGSARSSGGDESWRAYGSSVALSCSRRGSQRLAEMALDLRTAQPLVSETDRGLLDLYEPMLLNDLANQIASALNLGGNPTPATTGSIFDPFYGDGGACIDLVERHAGILLTVAVPLSEIAALALERAWPPAGRAPVLTTVPQAMGATALQLQATLGVAELTLSDLEGLSPGDVLVLDAPINAGVALTLKGSSEPIKRGKLAEVGGETVLNF
jgi:hypothetical protein